MAVKSYSKPRISSSRKPRRKTDAPKVAPEIISQINLRSAIRDSKVLTPDILDRKEFLKYMWKAAGEVRSGNRPSFVLNIGTTDENPFLNAFLQQKLGFKVRVTEEGMFTWRGGYQCPTPMWAQTFIRLCRSGMRHRKKGVMYVYTARYYLGYCA